MNTDNKNLNLALRIMLIATWVMSNISIFAIFSGLKNVDTKGLDKDNVAERLLNVISDFASKTIFYYITFGMVAVCLVLAVITRYKTRMVSYVFKILTLGLTLMIFVSGFEYVGALSACKGLSNLTFSGTSQESVAAALASGGLTKDVDSVASTLVNKDAAAAALGAYIVPILILFILMITSIHCLAKKSDPNAPAGGNEMNGNYPQ